MGANNDHELKEARGLLAIRADHAGRLADEVRELEAERDGLLAKIERVRASAQDGLENSDYDFGLSSFWVLDALSTTPAQSLANLQAATVLEYIDGPGHAESLRDAKAQALSDFARTVTIQSPYGHEVTPAMARTQISNQAFDRIAEYRKTTESETNHE